MSSQPHDLSEIPNLSILTALEGRYQWRYCKHEGCGVVFKSNYEGRGAEYCERHAELNDDPHGTRHYQTKPHKDSDEYTCRWVIQSDPSGDFVIGSPFLRSDVFYGLKDGVLPIGMSFRRGGESWTITGRHEITSSSGEVRDAGNGKDLLTVKKGRVTQ